jgi:hypothetical protein
MAPETMGRSSTNFNTSVLELYNNASAAVHTLIYIVALNGYLLIITVSI